MIRARATAVIMTIGLLCVTASCGSTGDASNGSADAAQRPAPDSPPTTPRTDAPAARASSTLPSDAFIRVVDARNKSVDIASTERIIPLDGDIAEIVFALGFGDRVVATDLSATFPPEADALPQIGYQRALNAEPILAFEPTLLIGTELAGPTETIDDLERIGVPVVIAPTNATPEGPAAKIRAVAAALGADELGDEVASLLQTEIDGIIAAATPIGVRVAALYLRGESVQLLFGEGSGIDWIIDGVGATDIADDLGVIDNAPITTEALLAAAPDVYLVTTSGLASVGGIDGLLRIPGLAQTPAGKSRAVLAYDDQLMLGNGPRTAAFMHQLQHDLLTTAGGGTVQTAARPPAVSTQSTTSTSQ